MAQTYVYGDFASSNLVGVPEDIESGMAELVDSSTPLIAACAPNLNNLNKKCTDVTHKYFEKTWRPLRTTLNGALASGATSVTFTDKAFKAGELVAIGEEVISLDVDSGDHLTFSTITRSVGTGADATHADGTSCRGLGKAWTQGSAAGTADMIVEPNQVTNYCQIFKRNCGVSGTAAVLDEYHRSGVSRYDANVAEQQANLLQEIDTAMFWGVAQAASGTGTEGRMDGIYERINGHATSMSGATPTRDDIRTELRASKDYGGKPSVMICSDYMKDVIDDWQLPRVQVDPASPAAKIFGTDVTALSLGGSIIKVIPSPKFKTHILIITPEFIRVGPLRPFKHTFLGVDGDRIRGEIVGEYTMTVAAPKAHRLLYSVAES